MLVQGEDDLARLGRAFNEMAEGLERQINQLEELSRVQRRFVADVSHELRTPLTTVRMASELIYEARGGFEPTLGRSAELLNNQLDRFEALLGDLLEISRFDAGAAVLDVEAVDARGVVNRVTEILAPLAERKGSVLRLDLPAEPAVAEIDSRRVERIVRNLVANALEHGEGRPVDVTVRTDGEAVAISVRDHGVGLRDSEAAMVFNRFWRADPARARTTGGTGLGLSIALEDAHLHGGRLEVWGRRGRGAHFLLTLPCRAGVVLAESPLPLVPPDEDVETRALRIVRGAGPGIGDGRPGDDPDREPQPAGEPS
jgi:two-component system sensor histidine kinase MtrB